MTDDAVTISRAEALRIVDSYDSYAAAQTGRNGADDPTEVYHHPGWRNAYAVYRQTVHWLASEREGVADGQLPLVQLKSRLFGRRLISLPWVDEAGAIGEPKSVAALMRHVRQQVDTIGGSYSAIIKQPPGSTPLDLPDGWTEGAGDKVLMRLRLANDPEQLWKDLSPKVRNQVRKAEKSGLTTERGGPELLKDFFEVYARNMRDLGSPSHSLKFFQTLVEGLGDLAAVYCTRHEGLTVGGGIVLNNGASLDIPWASSLRDYNRMCVNHGMYWKILSDACEAGYEWFHFGRSSIGSGQYKFKKQWGAEETPLNWWIYDPKGKDNASTNATAVREKFGLAQRLWTKLPLWASKRLGPLIIRYVP